MRGEAPPIVDEVLRTPGQPLDHSTLRSMQMRFGRDISTVRVHQGAKASQSARAVEALAYTVGRDVVFRDGQYSPGTASGKKLLAHELSHVAQQRNAPSSGPVGILDSPAHEAEADRAAEEMHLGESLTAAGLQRAPAGKKEESTGANTAGQREQAFAGVQHAVGQDPESLVRIDTVTVVELGANDWCVGCVDMRSDLSELVAEFSAKPQRMRFRVFSINQEVEGNEEIAEKIKKRTVDKGVPQTFVYVDNQLVHPPATFIGYEQGGRDYKQEIRDIYNGAQSRGVFTGMKIGASVGAAAGGIAGGIAGGVIGNKSGNLLGGIGLGGLIGGAGGALLGLGLGALFGAIFGKDKGTAPLSKERIEQIQKFQKGLLAVEEVDSDLAVDVATYFADNVENGFQLDPSQKRALLKVLLNSLGRKEQRAVIKILENSSDVDILRIFAADEDLRLTDLANRLKDFDKDEQTYLRQILNHLRDRFPLNPAKAKTEGLLIENAVVRDTLRTAHLKTVKQDPGKPFQLRECCGVFLTSPTTPGITPKFGCVNEAACPLGEVGKRALQAGNYEPVVEGSFHTHPNAPPEAAPREAPSRADFETLMADPLNRGGEHYVVGPFDIYLITFDGGLRILGSTSQLLGVPAIAPPPGVRSGLELEYSPIDRGTP